VDIAGAITESINVNTGFGFFKDAGGHIVSKAQLPAGSHPVKDGFTYIEVADQAALDAVVLWQDPAELERLTNEKKIAEKIRADAIAELISLGDLPGDYK